MKILSVNIGKPKIIIVNDKEEYTGYFKKPVKEVYLGTNGVKMDNVIDKIHHGGKDKACYLYSFDHYNFWKNKYKDLDWEYGMFGENITLQGMDETKLKIGDIYTLGNAVIQVTQPRQPCYKMGIRFKNQRIVSEFIKTSYSGAYVRVLQEGLVKKEDEMSLIKANESGQSVAKIFELLYQKEPAMNEIQTAINNEYLSESTKKNLIEKHKLV